MPLPPKQPGPTAAWDRQPLGEKSWRQGSRLCVEGIKLSPCSGEGVAAQWYFLKVGRSLCLQPMSCGKGHPILLCPLAAHLLQLILGQGCPLNDTQLPEDARDTLVLEVRGVELPGPHAIVKGVLGHGQVLLQLQGQEGTEEELLRGDP